MPHALRRVDTGDEALADLEVIVESCSTKTIGTPPRARGTHHESLECILLVDTLKV